MTIDPVRVAALIAREFPFQSLTPEELLFVVNSFEQEDVQQGQILATPKTPVQKFCIVLQGKLQAEILLSQGRKQYLNFNPGDYYGEEFLLSGNAPPMSLNALEDSAIMTLDQDKFKQLLDQFPVIAIALEYTMESRKMARSPRFSWLSVDEMVFFITRKHFFFLIRSLILPIFIFLISIPLLSIGITEASLQESLNAKVVIGVSLAFLGIFAGIWLWFDWGNDYYIVTNQRVVWIEKVLLMYDSRDEAALYNVLATDTTSSWFGRLIGYGDVSARTFTGRIFMRNTAHPNPLASYIDGLRKRSEQIAKEVELKQMEDALAQALRRRRAPTPIDVIPNIPAPRPFTLPKKQQVKKTPSSWKARWENFLKVRYEQNGEITYRKAWPVLIGKILLPFLLLLLWIFGITQLRISGSSINMFISLIMLISLFGLLFWLWYNFTDWRNDIYRLTATQIFDIEKKPIGTERKKTADLENILTITHQRDILGILFNFGSVVITVGDTRFIFLDVYNPDRVHQDVAIYQEAFRQRKRMVEEARAREQMINWLLAYDAEVRKLE